VAKSGKPQTKIISKARTMNTLHSHVLVRNLGKSLWILFSEAATYCFS
jgi:hypothetical protein